MDTAYGRIVPTAPADRRLFIKPLLPDYLLKLSFDSVVSGDQEYGYLLLPAPSGGILKTFAPSELLRIWQLHLAATRNSAVIGSTADIDQKRGFSPTNGRGPLQVAPLED